MRQNHTNPRIRLIRALLAGASLATVMIDCAFAADADNGSKIETVVVTARREAENQQRVPIAITAVSQKKLDENNVQTLSDLQYLVPSMSGTGDQNKNSLTLNIRGQQQSASGQPGASLYLDEVPVPALTGAAIGHIATGPGLFFDLNNVEVLKGPQGTLFGRNAVGGALLLTTTPPGDSFGGRIQVGYGNYDDMEVDGAIDIPLVDNVLLTRLSVNAQRRNGYTHIQDGNHPSGIDADNRDFVSARVGVSFTPTAWLKNDTAVTFETFTDNGSPAFLTAVNPAGLIPFFFPSYFTDIVTQTQMGPRHHIPVDAPLYSRGYDLLVSNITSVELGDNLTFRNILGYDEVLARWGFDSDGIALPVFEGQNNNAGPPERQFSEEAHLHGVSFDQRLDWQVGFFYLDQPTPSDFYQSITTIFFATTPSGVKNGAQSTAIYGQANYDLSDLIPNLGVTGGLRYTWDSNFTCGYSGLTAACGNPERARSTALTWTVSLNYQATPDTMLYVASRRGYSPGGTNGLDALGNPLPSFGPQSVVDAEVGVKSDWNLSGIPIRTNADLYYQDFTNIQVTQFFVNPVDGVPTFVTRNAAEANLWGAELEVIAQLSDRLQLGANFDWLDLEYTSVGVGVDPVELKASRTGNRPRYKYGFDARYLVPTSPDTGEVSLLANWNWQATSGGLDNSFGGLVPSFGLLNLSANWNKIEGSPFDASFFVSNALNTTYRTGGFGTYTSFGIALSSYGEPRLFGLRLRYRFGGEAETGQ